MIKKVLLIGALLASGLAYGANVGAPLSVEVIPAGAPAVPGPAAAAGFTTLAYNWDFSHSTYSVQANWLDCVGNDASKTWHVGFPGGISSLPCNVNQAIDSLDSSTVLRLQYLHSYSGLGQTGNGNFVSIQTVTAGGVDQGGTVTASIPNFYIETTYRLDKIYPGGNPSGPDGVWHWQAGSNNVIECDYGEIWGYANGFGDGGCRNWGNGTFSRVWLSYDANQNKNIPAGWSAAAYHKYGALYTSDGSTSIKVCFFIDDIRQWCSDLNAMASQYLQRNWFIAWVGGNAPGPDFDTNLFIKSIRVWSCASWASYPDQSASHQCNGSTLFNDPSASPNSGLHGGLTYWQ